jgi:hypothetical protein
MEHSARVAPIHKPAVTDGTRTWLPVALCVHPDLDYVTIEDAKTGSRYILAQSRIVQLYKKETEYKVTAGMLVLHVRLTVAECRPRAQRMQGFQPGVVHLSVVGTCT